MTETPKVTVQVLKFHTLFGVTHDVGTTYDVDEAQAVNLVGQGLVTRTERIPPVKTPPASQPVEPMTIKPKP